MKREYYKNGKRHTAVLEDGSFIEVKTLLTVTCITSGKNNTMINNARVLDVASDAKTFFTALEKALEQGVEISSELEADLEEKCDICHENLNQCHCD